MSDDDEDGEWVDVHHSSDEDTGEIVSRKWLWCPIMSYVCQYQIHLHLDASVFLSWPGPGREAAGNSRGGKKSQSGGDQQQQAPDARRLQEDPTGTDGQGGQRSTWQRPEEEGRGHRGRG